MSVTGPGDAPADDQTDSGATPEHRERVLAIYRALAEQPTAERIATLDQLRIDQPELAEQLESLILGDDSERSGDAIGDGLEDGLGGGLDDLKTTDGETETVDLPSLARALRGAAMPTLERFELLGRLGRGGAGQVFRALDRETGDEVAIKLLRPELVDNVKTVLRFRREFRAVARLDHPNCIRVLDEGVDNEQRYYSMEYLRGGDLRRLVGAPPATLLTALIQVALALDYIHGHRIVHRDIKPANVLLARRDPPLIKLADFGIALRQQDNATKLTGVGQVVGTVDYMSPEQVEGLPLDPRSDLYSLGCMIWQLFAGRLPFEGSTVQRLVARVYGDATPLDQLCPELPPALSTLVAKLLERDPAERIQSALEVASTLAQILSELDPDAASSFMGELSTKRAEAFLFQPPLVGRSAEVEHIVNLATSCAAAEAAPTLTAIVAPAGAGKSGLIAKLTALGEGTGPGVTVLRLEISPDQARPLAPFPALAERLGAGSAGSTTSLSTAGSPWDLDVGSHLAEDEVGRARSHKVEWLAQRLRARAEDRPLLVVLEGMHNAARSAWSLLADLGRRLADDTREGTGRPVARPLILLTLQPDAEDRLEALAASAALTRIALPPLTRAEVGEMLTAMLGVGLSELPESLLDLVYGESRGSPLMVRSFLEELVERELLCRVPGGWTLSAELGELPPARDVVLARLDHLSEAALAVLEVAALVGSRFDTELLMRVAERSDGQILDAIDEGLRSGVIQTLKGSDTLDVYGFEQDLFVEELSSRLPAARASVLHGAIGRVLLEREVAASGLVRHFELSGDDALAYKAMRNAAEEARRALDFPSAARHLSGALARLDAVGAGEAERITLRDEVAQTLVVIGRARDAVPLLRENLELAVDQGTLAIARRRRKLGNALLLANDTSAGMVALRQALVELGDRAPQTRLAIYLRVVRDLVMTIARKTLRLAPISKPAAAARALERALVHRELSLLMRYINLEASGAHVMAYRRLAEQLDDRPLRVESLAWHSVAVSFLGFSKQAARIDAAARKLAAKVHDPETLVRLEILRGGFLSLHGDFDGAFIQMERSYRQATVIGDRVLLCYAASIRGWWTGLRGRWHDAIVYFMEARRLSTEIDLQWMRVDSGCGLCIALALSGRSEESLAVSADVIETGRELGMPAVEAMAIESRAQVAFLSEDYHRALELVSQADDLYQRHRLMESWGYSVHLFRYESLLWIEEFEGPDAVPDLLPQLRHCIRGIRGSIHPIPLFAGFLDLAKGLLARRSGHPRQAERLFERALAARKRLPQNGWDLWIRIRVACERRHLGYHPEKIRAELDEAVAASEEWAPPGMSAWLRRVVAKLEF